MVVDVTGRTDLTVLARALLLADLACRCWRHVSCRDNDGTLRRTACRPRRLCRRDVATVQGRMAGGYTSKGADRRRLMGGMLLCLYEPYSKCFPIESRLFRYLLRDSSLMSQVQLHTKSVNTTDMEMQRQVCVRGTDRTFIYESRYTHHIRRSALMTTLFNEVHCLIESMPVTPH